MTHAARRLLCILCLLLILALCLPGAASAQYNARLRKGTRISVMGDSISTYTGWSDARPITGPEYTYRYGEPYYGPKGGDFHNTDLLVSDTWWHQAATQLGGQILMSNAANSSGLMRASYPSIPEWEHYLKDMRAYLSRPYYMGVGKVHPDIIALYIGSADVTGSPSTFGSVEAVNFSALIKKTGKNTYTYAEPATVAEAYCILLHKLQVTYPKAEIYCFTVLPNAGGKLSNVNTRLNNVYPFNEMIKGVAAHYGAYVVDIFDEFALDPDGDGVATQADCTRFQSYFHNDPHPNAAGFDVITNRFVSTILENSRFVVGNRNHAPAVTVTTSTSDVDVETSAGKSEPVKVTYTTESEAPMTRAAGSITIRTSGEAVDYLTPSQKTVNYAASSVQTTDASGMTTGSGSSTYTVSGPNGYWAEGGHESSVKTDAPAQEVAVPLITGQSVTVPSQHPTSVQITGDQKTSSTDGAYDYTETLLLRQGSVTVTTEDIVLEKKQTASDMHYVNNRTPNTSDNDMITDVGAVKIPDNLAIPSDHDFQYIGSDKFSEFASAHVHTYRSATYPGEEPVYTAPDNTAYYVHAAHSIFMNRGLVVDRYYFPGGASVEGTRPARWDHVQHFTLANKNGQTISTYCADKDTPAQEGYNYNMENLEDASYYSEEEARKIRIIANNGYWGTESGYGSLSNIKSMMRDSGKFTTDEINALTDGMAMMATQYAIWSNSNRMTGVNFINAYYTTLYGPTRAADKDDTDLIFKLFFHLLDLAKDAPVPDTNTSNTVITEKNFLTDVRIVLTDKPASLEENLDGTPDNDVYIADLSFALGVKPLENNDDHLLVTIEDGNGNVISAGRIAGDLKQGETHLKPDADGRYTLSGVELCEEASQTLVIRMQGTQDLKKDVYLFTSEIKDDPSTEEVEGVSSQTMVGVAEGDYGVNVQMNLFFSLNVEDDRFSINRFWRNEKQLPAAPTTGDASALLPWAAVMLVSCAAMASCLKKKRAR